MPASCLLISTEHKTITSDTQQRIATEEHQMHFLENLTLLQASTLCDTLLLYIYFFDKLDVLLMPPPSFHLHLAVFPILDRLVLLPIFPSDGMRAVLLGQVINIKVCIFKFFMGDSAIVFSTVFSLLILINEVRIHAIINFLD